MKSIPYQSSFLSGRRVLYDYGKFGDSPACLSTGKDISGRSGVWQGYGYNAQSTISYILSGTVKMPKRHSLIKKKWV